MMNIVLRDNPYIFFYHEHNIFGMDKTVQGFMPVPDGMIRTVRLTK
jgi:ABC-type transport system substrate-binding protein